MNPRDVAAEPGRYRAESTGNPSRLARQAMGMYNTIMKEASVRDAGSTFRRRLGDLRAGLLRLHKALLDAEQISYERIHGRVDSPGQLLHLVMKDPWFTWLLPLSKLVVRIDEILDDDDPSADEARTILTQVQTLLKPSEHGEGFERNYYEALQRAPDVVLAHAGVKKLLSTASR